MTKKSMGGLVAVLLVLSATLVMAADVTGNWAAEMKTPDGSSIQLSFTFKQDGSKLTGSVTGPQGGATDIAEGKVDGNKLSFNVSFNGMTIKHEGVIDGDQITLTTKSDDGNFPGGQMILKRAK